MISFVIAVWITRLVTCYLGVGIAFAFGFASRWAGTLDPVAQHPTVGFRILAFPGAVLLWPYLLYRLRRSPR